MEVVLERLGDLLEQSNIVLFSPEDLKLVKEGPSREGLSWTGRYPN